MKMLTPATRFLAAALLAGVLTAPASAAVLIIDDFSTDQGPLTVAPPLSSTDSSSATGGGIIGSSRDLVLSTDDPGPSALGSFVQASGGIIQLADNSQFQSNLLMQWDGNDNDPGTLDTLGLGGADLTFDGNNAIEIGLAYDDLPATLEMTIYSMDGGVSSVVFPSTGLILTDLAIYLPFASFTGDADFSNVGAIELLVSSPLNGLDIAFDYVQTGIAPVPVPAGMWLFGSALLGLTLTSRRRRTD